VIEAIHAGNDATRDCIYSQSARFRLSTECLPLIEELSGFPNRRCCHVGPQILCALLSRGNPRFSTPATIPLGGSPKPNSHFCGLGCCLSFEWCGEGKLRTPKYENQKSRFFLYLEFRFSEQNGEIQPEKVTRKIARKKVCIINHIYFLAERGGFEPPLGCLFPKTV
jgi:hypothetical protein